MQMSLTGRLGGSMNLFLVVLKLRQRRELSVTEPAEVSVLNSFFTNQTRVLKHVLHQPAWRQTGECTGGPKGEHTGKQSKNTGEPRGKHNKHTGEPTNKH